MKILFPIFLIMILGNQALAFDFCARHKAVVSATWFSLRKDCTQVTATDLPSVKSVSFMFGHDMSDLKPSDFDDLTNVTELEIQYTDIQIDTLHNVILKSLPNLVQLRLHQVFRRSVTLPSNLFEHNRKLKVIQAEMLGTGVIAVSLQNGVFDSLVSLEKIDLSYNDLTRLPGDLFANNPQLLELDLSNIGWGKFKTLPSDFFKGNPKLKILALKNEQGTGHSAGRSGVVHSSYPVAGLTSLPQDFFDSTPDLKVLIISGHKNFMPFSRRLFSPLTKLQELDLMSMPHAAPLVADVFNDLSRLELLNLRGYCSSCKSIEPNLFNELLLLNSLDLTWANDSKYHKDQFVKQVSLKNLAMNSVQAKNLPVGIFDNLPLENLSIQSSTSTRENFDTAHFTSQYFSSGTNVYLYAHNLQELRNILGSRLIPYNAFSLRRH